MLCSVCLRESTSYGKVTDEKGSMPENQPNRYKILATIIDLYVPGLFSSLQLKWGSLFQKKAKETAMN